MKKGATYKNKKVYLWINIYPNQTLLYHSDQGQFLYNGNTGLNEIS